MNRLLPLSNYAPALDILGVGVYLEGVSAPYTPLLDTTPTADTAGRKRRRAPSLSEQQRRSARIRPFTEAFKADKAAGRWR